MYKYTNKLLPTSFENIFKKFGNFERSLNYQLNILNMSSLQCYHLSIYPDLQNLPPIPTFKNHPYLSKTGPGGEDNFKINTPN